uniref:MHC class I-like antigen recognition-like domain-containing protein n=1 Tax=Sinocyclocheilus rhinocerous TaxID=307959 RepID=A0A673L1N3_9TELE
VKTCLVRLKLCFSLFVFLSSGKHSLRYFYAGVSGVIDFPEFTAVGLVDDEQFMYFDSNIKKAVPKTEWIRQNEGADYWDRQTQPLIGSHQTFKNNIQHADMECHCALGVLSLGSLGSLIVHA